MFTPSSLESEDFSVASFLNSSLDITSQTDGTDASLTETYEERLQRRMAELALHLQVQTQKCHDDIGRVATELRAVFPRCAADMTRIGIGLQGLQEDASGLLQAHVRANLPHHPLAVQYSSPSPFSDDLSANPLEILETLSTLHALQTNLQKTKSILEAAASWDTILSSIPPLIASSNLSEAVSAWTKLQEGAVALQPLPGREKREEAIQSIRGEILSLLKPQLLHALQRLETRLGPLQKCVSLYHALGTLENLKEEYIKSRPTSVHRLWFEFVSNASKDIPLGGVQDTSVVRHPSSTALIIWLPTWYDAISALLNEERSRTLAVFGLDLVPEVLIRILQECFRPILTSLKTRLSTCYPPDADEQSSDVIETMGSFDTISTAYEITVRFLSDIYELFIPLHADKKNPTSQHVLTRTQSDEFTSAVSSILPSSTLSRSKLYALIQTTFAYVASPFVPYQINFAALEMQHSSFVSKQVVKDLQLLVNGRTISVGNLRKAADKISEMIPSVFPLAQAALTRFELFNCGYWAPNALSTVDSLLSRHIQEMVMTIKTLSKSVMNTDGNKLSSFSDEQSFQTALDIFKNTGSLKRDLSIFMGQVSEQMRALASRMAKVKEYHANPSKDNNMPEELSHQDIHLLLAKAACANSDEEDRLGADILVSLADKEPDSLFPELNMTMRSLVQSCQTFVCDVCSVLPRYSISAFSTLTVWSDDSSDDATDDSYGYLPQTLITQIGEHLLSLVQIFEPFASDPAALSLGNIAMENITDVPLSSWSDFAKTIGYGHDTTVSSMRMKDIISGSSLTEFVLMNTAIQSENESDNEEADSSSTIFCNQWLDVITSTITAALLDQTMKIPKLSRKGCEQLVVDYGYLMNVMSALGLPHHPHPLLSHITQILKMSDDELKARLEMGKKASSFTNIVNVMDRQIAQLRNIYP